MCHQYIPVNVHNGIVISLCVLECGIVISLSVLECGIVISLSVLECGIVISLCVISSCCNIVSAFYKPVT